MADPESAKTWSGLPPFMLAALRSSLGDVHAISPLSETQLRGLYAWANQQRRITGKWSPAHLNPLALQIGRRRVQREINRQNLDLVFAITASTYVSAINKRTKVVYCADGTYSLLQNYYDHFSGIHERTSKRANSYEQAAISRADALVYSSKWAARSAIEDYGADPAKITILPFGANITDPPKAEPPRLLPADGSISLFLLGVEWERKGVDVAIAACGELRRRGIDATLTVVGCEPPDGRDLPEWVTNIRYLSKSNPSQFQTLIRLFRQSDLFILPSRAECAGVVFSEAAAFGLPVIAADTGGVSAAVLEGETGLLLPENSSSSSYADKIMQLTQNPELYTAMSLNSRRRFEQVLNWDAWAAGMTKVAMSLS